MAARLMSLSFHQYVDFGKQIAREHHAMDEIAERRLGRCGELAQHRFPAISTWARGRIDTIGI
jgi:hypothetical protein